MLGFSLKMWGVWWGRGQDPELVQSLEGGVREEEGGRCYAGRAGGPGEDRMPGRTGPFTGPCQLTLNTSAQSSAFAGCGPSVADARGGHTW